VYVFHDRRLEALERADDVLAIAIERLVEAASFGSEPEYMAPVLNVCSLARWLGECPDAAGLAPTRRALRDAGIALARPAMAPHGPALAGALARGDRFAPLLEELRSAFLRKAGETLLAAVGSADPSAVVSAAGDLASAWLGTLLHPQTLFNKLVGFVLDPDQKQPTTTVSQRLTATVQDFATRVPKPHTAAVRIDLPPAKRRPMPPGLAGVEVVSQSLEANRIELRTEVMAADPNAAASRGRGRFLETVSAWRAGAPELRIEIPASIDVTMPDGATIVVEVKSFRLAPPRLAVTPSWADAPASEQAKFSIVADALTRAREEVDQGRMAQAISILWSAAEAFLRRDSELTLPPADLEMRLAAPFLRYFVLRQWALLGLYLDMSRATRPRIRFPVDATRLWESISSRQLQGQIVGRRAFLRHRTESLLTMLSDPAPLRSVLAQVRREINEVLFAARPIRNAYTHSRVRIAVEFEERYVYRWLETLLDVALNNALGQSRRAGFTMDAHLGSLRGHLASFERRLATGPPYDWLLRV
jgi:hypothetical protein